MAKRPFNITMEDYYSNRFDIDQEGFIDFLKNIGRKFGLVAKDLGEELEKLNKLWSANKEIKNTTPFEFANKTKIFFARSHLVSGSKTIEFLSNDTDKYLDNAQSLYCVDVFEDICKLGSEQKFENAKQLFNKLDGIRQKKLDTVSVRFIIYDQMFIDQQIKEKRPVICYPLDMIRIKGNDIYNVAVYFNNGDAAFSLYIGEMSISYDVIGTVKDNGYDEDINKIAISKPQTIDNIIKLINKHKDAYKKMETDLKSNLNKISQIASKYKADSSFVNDARKAISKAYENRLQFYYDILLDLITVCNKAIQ